MARSDDGDRRARWYGRVLSLVTLTGHLEEADVIWKLIETDIGGCTRAYSRKDLEGWSLHFARIRLRLARENGPIDSYPTWC